MEDGEKGEKVPHLTLPPPVLLMLHRGGGSALPLGLYDLILAEIGE